MFVLPFNDKNKKTIGNMDAGIGKMIESAIITKTEK